MVFTLIGLGLTLAGAGLLFFYGLPRRRIGDVYVFGDLAVRTSGPGSPEPSPDNEWKGVADRLLRCAALLNRAGFALIAVGTFLQMLGTAL